MRLSVGRLLDEAGLEDVCRDGGLYVALWRSGADAWRSELAVRPLTPPALGSHALLLAMHHGGVEAVFGENGTHRLLLAVDSAVLVPTSSSYHLESRGGDPRLLVVVGSRQASGSGHRGPEPRAVPSGDDQAAGHESDVAEDEWPAAEEQEQGPDPGPSEVAKQVDVEAHVEEALARIMAAAGPPPATEAMEEEDQRRESSRAWEAMEEDEGLEIVGAKEAHEVEPQETGLEDRAGPKMGEVQTCRHWAKGWCMRAYACRYAHPQPPVPQGVPQDLLLILQAIARVGALSLSRARSHKTMMREVVERAQGGELPAVGYAVACGGKTEWAVALPCGMAALLTLFPVVPWRDMATIQEANLGWVCTWHTHPASMDPHAWQAKAVVTYLSCSLPTAPGTGAQWWDRALNSARDGSDVAACPDPPREPVSAHSWTVSLHLPTVASRLAAADPEDWLLKDGDGPGLHLGQGMEVRTARLPSPVESDILEGLQFTRADGADVWTAVHRRLPDAWHKTFRPPGHERLVGVEWRVWAANSPCSPVVLLPKKFSPHPSWETVAVLWGWLTVRGTGGHVFTAPRGTVIEQMEE